MASQVGHLLSWARSGTHSDTHLGPELPSQPLDKLSSQHLFTFWKVHLNLRSHGWNRPLFRFVIFLSAFMLPIGCLHRET